MYNENIHHDKYVTNVFQIKYSKKLLYFKYILQLLKLINKLNNEFINKIF